MGAVFTDENLAMAVLASLAWPARLIPEPDWDGVGAAHPYDPDTYWYDVFDDGDPEDADEDKLRALQEECGYRFLNTQVVEHLPAWSTGTPTSCRS